MNKKLVILITIFINIAVVFVPGCLQEVSNDANENDNNFENIMYDVYPDTDEPPVLDFIWGEPELEMDQIARVTPYGVLEGGDEIWEPATEFQFYTKDRSHDPFYAACEGTVIYVDREDLVIYIRYGRNYCTIYHHIVDIPEKFQINSKVERGELIGYTELKNGTGWWEIEMNIKKGNVFRSSPAFDYFSEESKQILNNIVNSSEIWYDDLWTSNRSWTVTDGEGSWIKYLDEPEWYESAFRLGYEEGSEYESLEDFLTKNDMLWVLQMNYQ